MSAVACLLIGIANGAWGTLGAVYGARIGISTAEIALMMSLVVIAGAAMQLPAGRLSDKTDRRFVLAGAAFGAALFALADLPVRAALQPSSSSSSPPPMAPSPTRSIRSPWRMPTTTRDAEDFVKVSGGLLLLYGFGTMIGPLLAAGLMGWMRPEGLFLATALAHLCLAGYTLLRIRRRAPVPIEDRDAFKTQPAERSITPESLRLDPRRKDEAEDA